jgi:hypothetical protein
MEWNERLETKAEVERVVGSAVQRCSPCLTELSQSRYVVGVPLSSSNTLKAASPGPPDVKDKIRDKATRHVDVIMNAALKRVSVRSMEGCNGRQTL